jgi:hypothetical protein
VADPSIEHEAKRELKAPRPMESKCERVTLFGVSPRRVPLLATGPA